MTLKRTDSVARNPYQNQPAPARPKSSTTVRVARSKSQHRLSKSDNRYFNIAMPEGHQIVPSQK